MKKFKSYGLSCSVGNNNGNGSLGFNTETCYWSAHIYIENGISEHYSSLSYRKVCEWFTEKLNKYGIK